MNSRLVALQGLGGGSRSIALQGFYELVVAIPIDPYRYKGNKNAKLPPYLITRGGGRFRKRV